jgi:hypothetical protein
MGLVSDHQRMALRAPKSKDPVGSAWMFVMERTAALDAQVPRSAMGRTFRFRPRRNRLESRPLARRSTSAT